MKHYICTGECKGISDKPDVCQIEDCSKHGEQLEFCDCLDGRHNDHQTKDEEGKSYVVGEDEDYTKN